MAKLLIVLVIALVLEALGVVLLSKGIKQIGAADHICVSEMVRLMRQGVANGHIIAGIALEAVFFATLLYLLSQRDVTVIWPLTALGFLITAIAAKVLLNEQVSGLRWAGVALIVLGAMLVTWSEKKKTAPPPSSPSPPSATAGSAAAPLSSAR